MLPSAAAGAAVVKTAEAVKPDNSMLADMPGADLPPVIAPARCDALLLSVLVLLLKFAYHRCLSVFSNDRSGFQG